MTDDFIDRAALRRLLETIGGDVEDLLELVGDYAEDAPKLVEEIRAAARAGDADAMRIAAHTLKSNARDFGAFRLAALCQRLEQDCREHLPADPDAAVIEIAAAEAEAQAALSEVDLAALKD